MEPRLYVQIENKVPNGYAHEIITIGISQLPFNASEDEIEYGLEAADVAIQKIRDKIERIRNPKSAKPELPKPPLNMSAFHEAEPEPIQAVAEEVAAAAVAVQSVPEDVIVEVAAETQSVDVAAEPTQEYDPFADLAEDAPAQIMRIEPKSGVATIGGHALQLANEIVHPDHAQPALVARDEWKCPACGRVCFGSQAACLCGTRRDEAIAESAIAEAIRTGDALDGVDDPVDEAESLRRRMVPDEADRCPRCGELTLHALLDAHRITICSDPFCEEQPAPIAPNLGASSDSAIPGDVPTHASAFGIEVPLPPANWQDETITKRSTENAGQVVAVNSALTGIGYGGKMRHAAALQILKAFGSDRLAVESIKDLTKGEAHLILSWIDAADDAAKAQLAAAISNPDLTAVLAASLAQITTSTSDESSPAPEISPAPQREEETAALLGQTQGDVELSPGQLAAIETCKQAIQERRGGFIFITGKAGTGKSTVYRALRDQTRLVTVAPTGLAAINIGGMTIHRMFGFKIGPLHRRAVQALRGEKAAIVRAADAIAIDEISMVRADIMDGIDACLQKTLGNKQPFGGKLVIAFGDMWQLEPVVTDKPDKNGKSEREWMESRYRSPFWFDAHVFRMPAQATLEDAEEVARVEIDTCELTEVFRQSGDPEFVDALNKIRTGDAGGIHFINERAGIRSLVEQPVVLTFTNAKAEAINAGRLADLKTESKTYAASVQGEFGDKELPAPLELELKIGAQVMVLRNIQTDAGFVANGSIGTVTGFGPDGPEVELRDGRGVVEITATTWEKMRYTFDLAKDEIGEEVDGSFSQVPLKLAWAITTHKSQGQTLDSAMLELESCAFAHGQLYVALSRVRSFDGLYLRRSLTAKDLIVNPRVMEFCGVKREIKAEAFA